MKKKWKITLFTFLALLLFLFFRPKRVIIQNSITNSLWVELYLNDKMIFNDTIAPHLVNAKLLALSSGYINNRIKIRVEKEKENILIEDLYYNSILHNGFVFSLDNESEMIVINYSQSFLFTPYIQ